MKISEDKFWEEYKPQINHLDDNAGFNGCLYETFGEEVKYVFELAKKENRVWTVIEGDEGMVYSAGFHYVNRLGFFVTEKPYDNEEDYVEVDEDFDDEPDTVRVKITAEVVTTVKLEYGETIEDFKERAVDIYLHGAGENGHLNKEDLGGSYNIKILTEDEPKSTNNSYKVLYNTLSGYIQDCSGEGSQETEEIEEAWSRVSPLLLLDDSDKENLKTILDNLEPTSDLFGTLSKVLLAMGELK